MQEHAGNRLYLGLAPHYDGFDRHDFAVLAAIARKTGIGLLATNDALYHDPHYRPLADVVTAIREHVPIAGAGFLLQKNAERHLKGPREMARLFSDYPEALANTRKFFSELTFSLDELSHQYPDENADGETPAESLRRLVAEGAAERYREGVPEKVMRQIDYELELIHDKKIRALFPDVQSS